MPARPDDPTVPGLLILGVEGGVYTMNVRKVQRKVMSMASDVEDLDVLLLDAAGTSDVSVAVVDVLLATYQSLAKQGIDLWLAALPKKSREKMERTQMQDDWRARGKLYQTVEEAVTELARLHPD